MLTSPTKTKHKLSLRKRLFVKKSPKVGCYVDPESSEDVSQPCSRPISPVDPFLASSHSCQSTPSSGSHNNLVGGVNSTVKSNDCLVRKVDSTATNDSDHKQCCRVLFRRSRPQSLVEIGSATEKIQSFDKESNESRHNSLNCLQDEKKKKLKHNDIPRATIKFPKDDVLRKYSSFDHTDKPNCVLVKRLSADHLISLNTNTNCRSPEEDRSFSLDRKNRSKGMITRSTSRVGSMDSLARSSLLAAQVLRLIPTQEARERNFLCGRLASNSLLGAVELEHVFPDREVSVFVGTWNMNGQSPPRELTDFIFPEQVKHVPDILAIGTQESYSERTEWEICIQEILGPSHLLLHSAYLGTIHLSVFIRRDLIWFCSLPEDASLSVRPGTAFRTKGAVAISFALFGSTFLFVTAHLTAHQEKVKERVSDIKRIIRSLDLPKNIPLRHRSKDVTNNFDYVFWSGDLNFRLQEPRAAVLRWIQETKFPLPASLPSGIMHADQLTAVLADGAAFHDFREASITFPPTYKYDPGSQQFDTSSKQRAPAYTDRILFKSRSLSSANSTFAGFRRGSSAGGGGGGLNCVAYNSAPTICTSDHKPVWALFVANLRPGTDLVPLAAGLFNREVYLEGIKRRAAILDHAPGTSAVCNLQ